MANNDIGDIFCPFCKMDGVDRRVAVRKNVKSKLYLYCDHCGMIQPNLPGAQDIILSHAHIHGFKKTPLAEAMDAVKEGQQPEKSGGFVKEKKLVPEPESLKGEKPKPDAGGILVRGLNALFSD